jgi:hypothetical protein
LPWIFLVGCWTLFSETRTRMAAVHVLLIDKERTFFYMASEER